MPLRTPLLIDKNILQGWPKAAIVELSAQYELLMADALFFELISTDPVARYRCFSKLPEGENPIVLIEPIGKQIRHELQRHEPSGKPSSRPLSMRYRFHPQLRESGYEPPEEVQQTIAEENQHLQGRVAALIGRARIVADMIQSRMAKYGETRPIAIADLKRQALDLRTIRNFLAGFEPPPGEFPLPPVKMLDTSWAIVRHTQSQLLFSIDVCECFGDAVRSETFADAHYTRLEHDVLDFEYVALAAMEGMFATDEIKLQTMFKLLVPDGILISSHWIGAYREVR